MFVLPARAQDWAENDPTPSQDTAAHIRGELAALADRLESLNPAPPRRAEAGSDDIRDLQALIKRLLQTLDDSREYWDEEYLKECDES